MARPLRIAFDVDGVLRDLAGHVLRQLNDGGFFWQPKTLEELDHYDAFVELFEDKKQWRETLDGMNAWEAAPPIEPMVRVWKEFAAAGYDCIIVTSNSYRTAQIQTVKWLHEHLDVDGIEVHFVNDKMTVEFDAIIEDRPLNVSRASKLGRLGILVRRPWSDPATQKGSHVVRNMDPRFTLQLRDDERAFQFIEDKLQWYMGYLAGVREFSGGRSLKEGRVRKGGRNDPPTSPHPQGHPGAEPRP